jgi:hypothetical protein
MFVPLKASPKSWLAFELNVLRRMSFESAAIPFSHNAALGSYLKRWNIRVAANDPLQSAWTRSVASILNNSERLSAEDVNVVLEDAYVPRYKLHNGGLREWFNETDSWWFDNVRQNIDLLPTPISRAIASEIAMATGDYVLSFNDQTLELRQPLSNVFRRLWTIQTDPVNNGQNNASQNRTAEAFLAETASCDLMFLRLPQAHSQPIKNSMGKAAWREDWTRGGNDFWQDLEQAFAGKLGSATETKSQYLRLVEEILLTAKHLGKWAIAHVEDGFLSTQEIAEVVGRVRAVDTIFTKDFSELTGSKAVIITA